jgi:release factor glutamine methyltransferase
MGSNLAQIFRVSKMLKKIKYPDPHRIAKEIVDFAQKRKGFTQDSILKRLYKDEPWEYVKGEAEFCNLSFLVNRYTLIPRIETEQLVNECVSIIKGKKIKNIVDIGTGSGSIVISIINMLKDISPYSFYATEISKRALKVAKKNEKRILKKRIVKWISGDLIINLPKLDGDTILIANLPYIPTKQYEKLDSSVKDFEPKIALDGGEDGLEIYTRLFKQLEKKDINLKVIYIETEESIYKDTVKLVKEYFPKSKIKQIKDCFDRDRFLQITL